jgi:hypothetical protein
MAVLDGSVARPVLFSTRRIGQPVMAATFLAGVLSLVWAVWLARDAGDLAAQYAWTGFVRQHPGSAYNLSWYGGIHPASYSIISPYLMAWIGVRTTAVIAATASAALGAILVARSGIPRPLLPSLWLAAALWCNIACGRITYMLGIAAALLTAVLVLDGAASGADLTQRRSRPVIAALVGAGATMCSPVAGLFIEVLAAALFVSGRRRDAYLLAPGPILVVAATSLLFPFSGVQPFPWYAALATSATGIVVAVLVPRTWRIVRAGAWVYAIGVVLCWILPTPIGSNVERLALTAGAAILICTAAAGQRQRLTTIATSAAAAALAVWTLVQPVAGFVDTTSVTTTAADARPLLVELRRLHADQGRVEVVPLRSHWEASGIAPYVDLARGWNRQADVARNRLFYDGTLTPTSYYAWLREWSAGFVVLPAGEPDAAGVAEARIIEAGFPLLHPVWRDENWRVYRVEGIDPLASLPATVTSAGPAALTINVPEPGSVLLRIAWSPWLAIAGVDDDSPTHACLAQSGAWTELTTPVTGTFTVEARYTLDRGTPCPTRPAT